VAEVGSHRELLDAGGIYSRFHDLQFVRAACSGAGGERRG
jgi:hypothetical protein